MTHPPRRRALRPTAVVAAVAFAATGLTGAAAASGADRATTPATSGTSRGDDGAATAPTTPALADGSTTVTLVTGDVLDVSVTDQGTLAVATDASTGSHGAVLIQTVGGHVVATPTAALPYVAAGVLDRRLFDVTQLLEDRYDDETTSSVPLVAQYAPTRAARSALPAARTVRSLPSIDGAALATSKKDATSFWKALAAPKAAKARSASSSVSLAGGVTKLWLDGRVQSTDTTGSAGNASAAQAASAQAAAATKTAGTGSAASAALDWSRTIVGADKAWAEGYDGTGSTVAVLDTGVDATHPDLAGAITTTKSFVPAEQADVDVVGHGTHVSSTVLGRGTESDGEYTGVAPGAKLLMGKVLGDDGYGQDSWIVAGMEWGAANADVVSMSLGDPTLTDGKDPISQALNTLSEETGTLFVVAAGNAYGSGTVSAPGAADDALTVGATDSTDHRAEFSSWGPRTGDDAIKPDLSAPGQGIVAARSQQAQDGGEGWYTSMDGTSMATPHVAGAAAIVHQAHPDWTGQELKAALVSSTDALDETVYEVGSGRLDVPAALDGVDASGSGFLGGYDWPHDGDDPVTRTLTYTNATDAAVTLDLALTLDDPDGHKTDAAHLSASTVTVPAHGSSDVTLTGDVDDFTGYGSFTGEVVGTVEGAARTVRTSVALYRESERYTLDLAALGRDGKPVGGTVEFYRYGDQYAYALPIDPATGRVAAQRLAPGTYVATAYLDVAGAKPGTSGVALVGNPHLVISDHDVDLTLDASKAVPVTLTTPRASKVASERLQWFHDSGIGGTYATYGSTLQLPSATTSLYAAPTGKVAGGRYEFAVRWRATQPPLDVAAQGKGKPVALDATYLNGSARLDGKVRLAAVKVGAGASADYPASGVRGKAVVVTPAGDVDTFAAQLTTAQDAGAALVVLAAGDDSVAGVYLGGVTVPVVLATPTTSAGLTALLARGSVTLAGTALASPGYLYDVSQSYPGAIPATLSVRPAARTLATVTSVFSDTRTRTANEARYDCRDYQWPPCLGQVDQVPTDSTRTDYVSTQAGTTWYSDVYHQTGWEQRGEQESLAAGSRVTQRWFAPLASQHTGPGYWGPTNQDTWFTLNVPSFGGAGGVTGTRDAAVVHSSLSEDGTVLGEGDSQAVYVDVPQKDDTLRTFTFEQTATSDPGDFAYSTRQTTDWTFVADTARPADGGFGETTALPFLQLGYDVATDRHGTVRAGSLVPLRVTPSFDEGVAHAGKIRTVSVKVSYDDGATWRTAPALRLGSSWTTVLAVPRHGANAVSLQVTASDDAGNAVKQTVLRAFGTR
ncbi:S8 family serine peptidase [Luteimicrobium sp. NPDC057192]|uniref:S8 family serine peptidase n=1 Tax=Luteimicrobium sp. NPDC057192 TaxID=3346042 RepID=UPI003645D4F7